MPNRILALLAFAGLSLSTWSQEVSISQGGSYTVPTEALYPGFV